MKSQNLFLTFVFLIISFMSFAQVQKVQTLQIGNTSANTQVASAALQIDDTNRGFLPPRMTLAQINAITNPAAALMVYCTDCNPKGLIMFDGSAWINYAPILPIATMVEATRLDENSAQVTFNPSVGASSYEVVSFPPGYSATGTSSPINITGISNVGNYTFTVKSIFQTGSITFSNPSSAVNFTFLPSAPASASAVVVNNNSASLSFTAPVSTGGSPITSYTVTSNPAVGSGWSGTASPISLTGLTPGTDYTFSIVANNTRGASPATTTTSITMPSMVAPNPPTSVYATPGDGNAIINWTAPINDGGTAITGYLVTVSPAIAGIPFTTTASPYTVEGLTNGTAYTFEIVAVNSVGTSSAARTTPITPSAIDTPERSYSLRKINPNYMGNAILVRRSSDDTTLAIGFDSSGNLDDAGLTAFVGTGSGFVSTWYDQSGNGINLTQTTNANQPLIVENGVIIKQNSKATLKFSGSQMMNFQNSFTANISSYSIVANGTNGTLISGVLGSLQIYLTSALFGANRTNQLAITPVSSINQLNVLSLTTNANVVYGVNNIYTTIGTNPALTQPITSIGNRGTLGGEPFIGTFSELLMYSKVFSNSTRLSLFADQKNYYNGSGNLAPTVFVPSTPTNVVASAGTQAATVAFAPPVDNGGATITGFTVTSSPDGKTATGTTSPITVTGLTAEVPYTFTVVATNSVGNSAASATSNAVSPIGNVPVSPTNVYATAGIGEATINFTPPTNTGGVPLTGYNIEVSPAINGSPFAATTSPVTITGLTNGTTYTFTVKAINSIGSSAGAATTLLLPLGNGTALTPAAQPVAAYSLRKVVATYTGPAITVRNDAGNVLDIAFDANGNLDTSSLQAHVGSGSGFVTTIYDQTTGSRHLTQNIETNQPRIADAEILYTMNGKPAFIGDATDAFTATAPYSSLNEFLVMSVTRPVVVNTANTFFNFGNLFNASAPNASGQIVFNAGGNINQYTVASGGSQLPVNTTAQLTFINSSTTNLQSIRKNGTQVAVDNTGQSILSSSFTISGVVGYYPEFIFYNTVLPTAQMAALENDMMTYWNGSIPTPTVFAPSAPTSVLATAGNATGTVTFQAPTNTGNAPIISYTISSTPGAISKTVVLPGSYNLEGLTNGVAYTFNVTATNVAGTSSIGTSNSVTPLSSVLVTVPNAPVIASIIGGSSQGKALITYNEPANNGGVITQYEIAVVPGNRILSSTTTAFEIDQLSNGVTYTFSVRAKNSAGFSNSSATMTYTVAYNIGRFLTNHFNGIVNNEYTGTPSTITHTTGEGFNMVLGCLESPISTSITCPSTVTSFDGLRTYTTVLLNGQCWINQNIQDLPSPAGNTILYTGANGGKNFEYNGLNTGIYANNTANLSEFGRLYQYNAAMNAGLTGTGVARGQGVCPVGFHVPTSCEYKYMLHGLGQDMVVTGSVNNVMNKIMATNHGGTNVSGWAGVRGGLFTSGYQQLNQTGRYRTSDGNFSLWISSTESIVTSSQVTSDRGFSVRCLKND